MKIVIGIISFLIILTLFITTCEIDHGLYPVDYKITGNVIFFKGKPPVNTDRIEVFALKEFPPDDPQNFLYVGQSGALNYADKDSVPYEIRVSPTSYQLIGVVWKEKGKNWNLTGLMGIYTGGKITLLPDSVIVSKKNPVADSVNFYANWEVVNKNASIAGTITYVGEWPKETQLLLLAVYRVKPTSDFSYLAIENVDYAQPLFVASSTYELAVNSGSYNYFVLYWVGKNISKLTDLVEIGFYANPDAPGSPGTLIISDGEHKADVNIHVNFNAIEF